jgi:putative CocE/NonD family hydrolase
MTIKLALPIVLCLLVAAPPARAQPPQVVVDYGVRARMRDGVSLVADVYRPSRPGRYPVVLERTPYNRRGDAALALELAARDYVVVLQDTRGRYESEGEFYPFRHEGADGYDSVEWAAGLEYSNGKVGMMGGSYVGATQMLAAAETPPHLVSIFPYVTASEYYNGWTYQSGAFEQWFASSWTSILAVDTLRRGAESRANERLTQWVETVPVEAYPLLETPPVADLAPYYRDWIKHERDDEYWKPWKVSDRYPKMTVKGLHGCGWHDLFLEGSLKNYRGMGDTAATKEARDGQRLIVGPWGHTSTSP